MGFGFNLLFVFLFPVLIIIVPITTIILFFYALSLYRYNRELFIRRLKLFVYTISSLIAGIIIAFVIEPISRKMKVDQTNIYGEYIIDRSKYPGRQADWQYNSFKFELRSNHKLYFYEMENGQVTKMSIIPIYFCIPNHLVLVKDSTNHHIVSDNPTLYRETFSFYYVFKSSKFGNVFFKRGCWKKLD